MARLERHPWPVVEAAWLHDRVRGAGASELSGQNLLIIEVGWQVEGDYLAGHIPAAIYLDTESFERPPSWNVLPSAELERVLLSYGISCDRPVVLYGRDPLAVARAALVLLYAGVQDMRWLEGGIEAWRENGYKLETGPQTPLPAQTFGCPIPANPEYLADLSQVRRALAAPNAVVACVQTWEEFTGQTSGYCYIQARGRIPGSVWAGEPGFEARKYSAGEPAGQTDRRCRESARLWRSRGITPDKRVVFYCGTGWRASLAFLYTWLMGWQDIAVYDGGWLEWSAEPSNPIQTGEP